MGFKKKRDSQSCRAKRPVYPTALCGPHPALSRRERGNTCMGRNSRMPDLIQPGDMPVIPGLVVPYDFYWVLQHPAPLAGMPYPSARTPWHDLAAAGFQHVICLEGHGPAYDPSPLTVSWRTSLQDLYGGSMPRDPAREEQLVYEATQAVVSKLHMGDRGRRPLRGRHRAYGHGDRLCATSPGDYNRAGDQLHESPAPGPWQVGLA